MNLRNQFIAYPSMLILILDSNGKIRGKNFLAFTSSDSIIDREHEYQIFFQIPSNLQGERIEVLVQLWGIITSNKQFPFPITYGWDFDEVYGDLPQKEYPFDQVGYVRDVRFKTFSPFYELSWTSKFFQSLAFAGIFSFLFSYAYAIRKKIGDYLEERFPGYKTKVFLFLIFVFFLLLYLILQIVWIE